MGLQSEKNISFCSDEPDDSKQQNTAKAESVPTSQPEENRDTQTTNNEKIKTEDQIVPKETLQGWIWI